MTIEEFTQLYADKVVVTPRLNGTMYHIKAKEGYCILTPEHVEEDSEGNVFKTYKYSVILRDNYDWSTIQILTTDSVGEGDIIARANTPSTTSTIS